jgi:two-component system response regulator NreC
MEFPPLFNFSKGKVAAKMSTRVVIVDDHLMLRDALSMLLEKHGFTVAGVAGDGAEGVRVARSVRPQVVIMDLSMPIMNGIDAGEEISRDTGIPVILLTMHSEQNHVVRAFRAGVAAYVLKSKAATDLLLAIAEVIRGNVYLSPGISALVVREMLHKSHSPADQGGLTLRERQVLQLVAEGKSTKELAELLGISIRTGESHRSRIMEKLEIHETAGLVRYAIREGLIEA